MKQQLHSHIEESSSHLDARQGQLRLKRTTFTLLISILFFLLISAGISIWRQYEHTWDLVEVQSEAAALRLDRWIRYPLRFFDALPLETIVDSNTNEAKFFQQIIDRSNRFYAIKFIDKSGKTIKHFGPYIQSEPENIWENAISQFGFLQFGRSFFEEESNIWLMPIRHLQPVGKDKLTAIAYLDGRAIEQVFKSIHPDGNGSVSIFRKDGLMLARIPFAEKLVGKSFSEGKLFKEVLPVTPVGVTRAPKKTDGIERVVAHRSLTAYPLVITVGLNVSTILDNALTSLLFQNISFLGIFLVALFFAYILWQQVKAAEITQNNLLDTESELRKLAAIDPLTGCFNRRAFFRKANVEKARYGRSSKPYSIVMIDLDKFKEINDTYGHSIGDEILTSFAQMCLHKLRTVDFIGRYGGEEFILFLPETPLGPAIEVADRLRKQLNRTGIETDKTTIDVTFSAGVATVQSSEENIENVIKRADEALYNAKQAGRNQVKADETLPFV